MVVQDIIPDKILLVEFQPIGPRRLRPEYEALSFGIKAAGAVNNPRPGGQFPQIYPAGPPEGYLHQLSHRGPDYPGIGNPRFRNFHRGNTGRGGRNRRKGDRFPDRRSLVLLRGPDKRRGRRRVYRRRGRGGRFRDRGRGGGGNRGCRRGKGLSGALGFRFRLGTGFRLRLRKNRGQGFGKSRQGRRRRRRGFPDRLGEIKNRLLQIVRPGTFRRIFRSQDRAGLIGKFPFRRIFRREILKNPVFKTFGNNFRNNFRLNIFAFPLPPRLAARQACPFGSTGKGAAGQKEAGQQKNRHGPKRPGG
jgi:hypothetical protein